MNEHELETAIRGMVSDARLHLKAYAILYCPDVAPADVEAICQALDILTIEEARCGLDRIQAELEAAR